MTSDGAVAAIVSKGFWLGGFINYSSI